MSWQRRHVSVTCRLASHDTNGTTLSPASNLPPTSQSVSQATLTSSLTLTPSCAEGRRQP